MRTFVVLAIACLVLAVGLAACTNGTPVPEPTDTPPSGVVRGRAAVDSIDVMLLESFPVQVRVIARGNLPDGCTTLDKIEQARTARAFEVTITTVRPADRACTEALVPFEVSIALDVLGLPAGKYTVSVNGVQGSFELAADNK